MKKLLSLIIFLLTLSIVPVQAATQSADISDEEIKENISERLKKVAGVEAEDEDDNQLKYAWAGEITDITTSGSLSIITDSQTRLVQIAENAKILNDDRQSIKFENLEIDQYILAMGYLQDNQVLDTKRLVFIDKPKASKYKSFLVSLTQIDKDSLTVKNLNDTNQSWTLEIDDDTKITQTVDDLQSDIQTSDLKPEDKLVIIATPDSKDDSILITTNIHLFNGRTILADPDSATASAETKE